MSNSKDKHIRRFSKSAKSVQSVQSSSNTNPFEDCTQFVNKSDSRLGRPGYLTDCDRAGSRDHCDSGYTQIGRCGTGCSACGGGRDYCYWGSGRRLCRRNITDFDPVKDPEKNVIGLCCSIPITDGRRITNDCPPTYYQGSPSCNAEIRYECLNDPDPAGIIKSGCDDLANIDDDVLRHTYNRRMEDFCIKNKDKNLNHPQCVNWCRDNRKACNDRILSEFCKDKIGDPDYDRLCGCFYPQEIYENIRKKISEDFIVPDAFLDGGRKCYFPTCYNATVQYDDIDRDCRSVDLVNCIQNIDINANNSTIGEIRIDQIGECGRNITKRGGSGDNDRNKCDDNEDCKTGQTCNKTTGFCDCTSDSGCSGTNICVDGECRRPPTADETPIYKKWWFWLIIIFVVMIIIGGIWWASGDDTPSEDIKGNNTSSADVNIKADEGGWIPL